MVCVSTSSRTSLENVDRWVAEIRLHNISAAIVLVLTKNDLSEDENAQVRYDDLVVKRELHSCTDVVVCSAKNFGVDDNVLKAFNTVIKVS